MTDEEFEEKINRAALALRRDLGAAATIILYVGTPDPPDSQERRLISGAEVGTMPEMLTLYATALGQLSRSIDACVADQTLPRGGTLLAEYVRSAEEQIYTGMLRVGLITELPKTMVERASINGRSI